MIKTILRHTGLRPILNNAKLWYDFYQAVIQRDEIIANKIFNAVVESHRKHLRTLDLSQPDRVIDLMISAYTKDPLNETLRSRINDFSPIFEEDKGRIRLTRA